MIMKNSILLYIIVAFTIQSVNGQSNQRPVVENIWFSQRTDSSFLVDIYYDLWDADNDLMTVSMQVTTDNYLLWNISCNLCSGDIGDRITSGTGKHIVWDFASEHPGYYGDKFIIKIVAEDHQNLLPVEWITIPAGEFTWGMQDEIRSIAYDYEIMKYEVTNHQYAAFLEEALAAGEINVTESAVRGFYEGDNRINADSCDYLYHSDPDCRIKWIEDHFQVTPNYGNHPVVEVTWFGANAFAIHYGYHLPTEEEWEKAARGKTGYEYPFGDQNSSLRTNHWFSGDPYDNGTTPVGYYNGDGFQTEDSPSPYGIYDMAGNVWEWTASYLSDNSVEHVSRGGCYTAIFSTFYMTSWYRNNIWPGPCKWYGFGFRCARTK